jgi:hypothetical protein
LRVYRVDLLKLIEEAGDEVQVAKLMKPEPGPRWLFSDITRQDFVYYGGMVYFAECAKKIKIGYTQDDPEKRVKALQTSNPLPIRLVGVARGTIADERALHELLRAANVSGEWFKPLLAVKKAVTLARSGMSASEIVENVEVYK